MADPEKLLHARDAARLLCCAVRTLPAMVADGRVTAIRRTQKKGSPFLFRPSDIAAAQRRMQVPTTLHIVVAWEVLAGKPKVELTPDAEPRFPRPSTAVSPRFRHRTYAGADGNTYASIENPSDPRLANGWADEDGHWHKAGTLPPNTTQWYVLRFPEN